MSRRSNRKRSKKRRSIRYCLNCGEPFPSKDKFQRFCKRCKRENQKILYKPHKVVDIKSI